MAQFSCTRNTKEDNSRNDSVEKYLKLASIDTLPSEIRKKHNEKAFSFIDLKKNDTVVRWYLGETALNFSMMRDSINYYIVSKIHFKKGNESNDTLNLARFYRFRAGFHKNITSQNDSALYYYKRAEKFYEKTSDLNGLAKVILFKGQTFNIMNDYSTAELEVLKARKLFLGQDDKAFLIHTCNLLGNIYKSNFDYKKALTEYEKGLDLTKSSKLDFRPEKAILLNNIGNMYLHKKEYRSAIDYFTQSSEVKNLEHTDIEIFIANYSSIFSCKIQLNDFEGLDEEFKKILALSKKHSSNEEFWLFLDYSKLCYSKGRIFEAQKYADSALILARKSKAPPYDLMNALLQVGKVNKERASKAFIEYDIQADSLLNKERRERSKFLKIQLETDEITEEKEKAIQQKWIQTSIITSLLIIAILLFIIYRQRSQKKEFMLVQSQQKANEEIYQLMLKQQSKEEEARQNEKKRIALELHDNVMNQLASTRFNLFSLTQESNSKFTKEHIDKIKAVEDEIRNLTHELVSENFIHDNSFVQLLQGFANQQNQLHSIAFQLELDSDIDWNIISSEIKMNLYRIIQEAVHNCNKHSKANKVEVRIIQQGKEINLTIEDNGIGFDQNMKNQGIGLQNMQQRIESIGGKLSISSILRTGTIIKCLVEIR